MKGFSKCSTNVEPSLRAPKTFYDLDSITEDDERTGYIHSYLETWATASSSRRLPGEKHRQAVLTEFMAEDQKQIQPSWARQWVTLAFCSGEDTDGKQPSVPSRILLPTKHQYTVFLQYFSQLRLDSEDRDEVALRIINKARKEMGLSMTLEYGDSKWSSVEDAEMQDDIRMDATRGVDDSMDSGQAPVGSAACALPYPEPRLYISESSLPSITNYTAIYKEPILAQDGETQSHGSGSLEPIIDVQRASQALSQDASSTLGYASSSISVPEISPIKSKGPRAFYDIAAITSPDEEFGTEYILRAILRWKRVREGDGSRQTRRSSGLNERIDEAKRKLYILDRIVDEFIQVDKSKVQPSWVSQWIRLVCLPHDLSTDFELTLFSEDSPTSLIPEMEIKLYKLLFEFFSILLDGGEMAKDDALLLLCRRRIEMNFEWTLVYGTGDEIQYAIPNKMFLSDFIESSMPEEELASIFDEAQSRDFNQEPRRACRVRRDISSKVVPVALAMNKAPESTPIAGSPPGHSNPKATQPPPSLQKDYTTSSGPINLESRFSPMFRSIGRPEPGFSNRLHIWARSRPELCETAPYFRAFQSGIHVDKKSNLIGYLLDGFPSPGDVWARDGRFIISHGGGSSSAPDQIPDNLGQTSDERQGFLPERRVPSCSIVYPRTTADVYNPFRLDNNKMKTKKVECPFKRYLERDQMADDLNIRRLLAARDTQRPVVLIAGSKYRWWPLLMDDIGQDYTSLEDHDDRRGKYVVLGWYLIRDAWQELEPGQKESAGDQGEQGSSQTRLYARWKFSFEWIEAQGSPWWISDLEAAMMHFMDAPCDVSNTAELVSDHIYGQEVDDQNTSINGGSDVEYDKFESHQDDNLAAKSMTISSLKPQLFQTCHSCRMTSTRIYHEGWFCSNANCFLFGRFLDSRLSTEVTLSYSQDFINRSAISTPNLSKDIGEMDLEFLDKSENPWSVVPTYAADLNSFEREHWQGRCCLSCGRLNSKVEWRRWVCPTCLYVIEDVPGHIYSVEQCTLSPPRLPYPDWFDYGSVDIQEVHMNWDNGLTVHSFALPHGGIIYLLRRESTLQADQMLRDYQIEASKRPFLRRLLLKKAPVTGTYTSHFSHNAGARYEFSCSIETESFEDSPSVVKSAREILATETSAILGRPVQFNEVLSCAYKKDQSMHFHSDDELGVQDTIASLSLGAPAKMSFRPKRYGKDLTKPPICLELVLKHGDILVMDGLGIQQNYQHRVVPYGLRFAATARLIDQQQSGSVTRYKPSRTIRDPGYPYFNDLSTDFRTINIPKLKITNLTTHNDIPFESSDVDDSIDLPVFKFFGSELTNLLENESDLIRSSPAETPDGLPESIITDIPTSEALHYDNSNPSVHLVDKPGDDGERNSDMVIEPLTTDSTTHLNYQSPVLFNTSPQVVTPQPITLPSDFKRLSRSLARSVRASSSAPFSRTFNKMFAERRGSISRFRPSNAASCNKVPIPLAGIAKFPAVGLEPNSPLDNGGVKRAVKKLVLKAEKLDCPPELSMSQVQFCQAKRDILEILTRGVTPEDLIRDISPRVVIAALNSLGFRLPYNIGAGSRTPTFLASSQSNGGGLGNAYHVSLPLRKEAPFFSFNVDGRMEIDDGPRMEIQEPLIRRIGLRLPSGSGYHD